MIRSSWKPKIYFVRKLNTDFEKKINNKKKIFKKFKIFNANFLITADLLGYMFFVYNGNKFRKIIISKDKIGFLLSSLIITRFNDGSLHTKKKKKKKNK